MESLFPSSLSLVPRIWSVLTHIWWVRGNKQHPTRTSWAITTVPLWSSSWFSHLWFHATTPTADAVRRTFQSAFSWTAFLWLAIDSLYLHQTFESRGPLSDLASLPLSVDMLAWGPQCHASFTSVCWNLFFLCLRGNATVDRRLSYTPPNYLQDASFSDSLVVCHPSL